MNKSNIINNLEKLQKTDLFSLCGNNKKIIAQSIINRLKSSDEINIANTGLVSSGKSTLFNILIGKADKERFKTGAARTTVSQDKEKIDDGIFLIDTPGIDVREDDDEIAFKALLEADIIVMIHNIKTGMPNRQEVQWLERICSNIKAEEEIKKRVMFLCSWIDERDTSSDYIDTINETKRLVFDAAKTEIEFFEVSAKRYNTGVKKNSNVLIDKSNIEDFKKRLFEKAIEYKNSEMRFEAIKESILDFCYDCKGTLQTLKTEHTYKIREIKRNHEKQRDKKLKNWSDVLEALKMKYQNVSNLIKERDKT